MDLMAGLIALLLQQTSITSVVSGGTAVQTIPAPTETSGYPAIVLSQISETNEYVTTGAVGMTYARVNIDCLAPQAGGGYGIARNLAKSVKATLDGFFGVLPDGTKVDFIETVGFRDIFDADATLNCTCVQVMITFNS